jgi:aminomethyltransferase
MNDPTQHSMPGTLLEEARGHGASPFREPQDTALASALDASSPSLADYRGVRIVSAFSSPAAELAALLTSAGIYDLGWRGFIRVTGKDRVRWLNNMVTNSVIGLEENAGCYSFVLNAQGRIQGDLDIYRPSDDPDALWLRIDRAQIESLTAYMKRYIIMDKVELEGAPFKPSFGLGGETREEWTALGIAGPKAAEILAVLGLPVSELEPVHLVQSSWRGKSVTVIATHAPLVPRYEIWIEAGALLTLWNALVEAGALPCGAAAVEQLRILEGTPAYGIDIADRDLPQETGQNRALHFKKGCYLGQEIVERIRSRGNVHRTLSGFLLEGDPPSSKAQILADDKPVGELTSATQAAIPGAGERTIAIGFIRREALDAGATLTIEGNAVLPCPLPFDLRQLAERPERHL